jgi:hypothetical protein
VIAPAAFAGAKRATLLVHTDTDFVEWLVRVLTPLAHARMHVLVCVPSDRSPPCLQVAHGVVEEALQRALYESGISSVALLATLSDPQLLVEEGFELGTQMESYRLCAR